MNELQKDSSNNWKSQAYITGITAGTLLGVIAAYLYTRAAAEDVARNGGKPQSVGAGEIIALGLAALGLIRQITELGKPQPKKK
jgi:hypothetical protein